MILRTTTRLGRGSGWGWGLHESYPVGYRVTISVVRRIDLGRGACFCRSVL
jgi:hypothetical protein